MALPTNRENAAPTRSSPQLVDPPFLDVQLAAVPEAPAALPERRAQPWPGESVRRRRFYVPLRLRAWLTFAAGIAWTCFSLWISRHWIAALGRDISVPAAIVLVAGIALIPGYLNIQLITSILLDRPPPLDRELAFPAVTLLVAAYNEEAGIGETLDYALKSEYPGAFEIVVADDGSHDRTREIVGEYAARDPRVRLLAAEHGGKARTLNAALALVTTPLVATIDADTLLMPYSLRRAVARMLVSPPDTVAVAGAVLVRNSRHNLLTAAQEWDYFLGIASVKRGQALLQGTLVAQGAFSVYDTTALRLVGGWPNKIGEDIVLTWSLLTKGGRSVFEPTAVAFTDVPTTWKAFTRQRRRWARGMIEGLRDHGIGLVKRMDLYSHAVAGNFLFPLLDASFTFAFIPGVILALTGDFAIVGPLTLLVLPLNMVLGGIMYGHQLRTFDVVGLRVRRNIRGFLFYFFCYQFAMSPISLSGHVLELVRARRVW
jgi:biofilm PGA synthesis N-glycosyltransferase PgaC